MTDPLKTVLTEQLGCRLPVIQTAMGWVSTAPLVSASIEAGVFGFLAAAVMTPQQVRTEIASIRAASSKPFGVNFHMFQPGAAEIVDIIIEHRDRVRAVSFGRGPDARAIARFKDAGILCMPTVGAVKHAKKMVELGVDMVVVQGGEGGGHTGSVPSTILLPQVLDAVKVPVVAAGGFADGRGLAAALAFGAVGVAMGTRFLMTRECPLPDQTKACYARSTTDDIIVSTKVDGLPQRMIVNEAIGRISRSGRLGLWWRAAESGLALKRRTGASLVDLVRSARGMSGHGGLSLRQAMMMASVPMLNELAMVDGDVKRGLMATGLVVGRLSDLPSCGELVASIEREARERLLALQGRSQEPHGNGDEQAAAAAELSKGI